MGGSSNRCSRLSLTTGTSTTDSLGERSRVISIEIETTNSFPALYRLEVVVRTVPLSSVTALWACIERDKMTAIIKIPPVFIVVIICISSFLCENITRDRFGRLLHFVVILPISLYPYYSYSRHRAPSDILSREWSGACVLSGRICSFFSKTKLSINFSYLFLLKIDKLNLLRLW